MYVLTLQFAGWVQESPGTEYEVWCVCEMGCMEAVRSGKSDNCNVHSI